MAFSTSAVIAALNAPVDQKRPKGAPPDLSREGSFDTGGEDVCNRGGIGGGSADCGDASTVAAGTNSADGPEVPAAAEQSGAAGRAEDAVMRGEEVGPSSPQRQPVDTSCGGDVEPSVTEGDDAGSQVIPPSTDDLVGSVFTGADGIKHGWGARPETDAFVLHPEPDGGGGGGHDGTGDGTRTEGHDQQHQHRAAVNDQSDVGAQGQRQSGIACRPIPQQLLAVKLSTPSEHEVSQCTLGKMNVAKEGASMSQHADER